MDRLRINVERYTVVQDESGFLYALRDGEPWRDLDGDGLILALAQEIARLRVQLAVDGLILALAQEIARLRVQLAVDGLALTIAQEIERERGQEG